MLQPLRGDRLLFTTKPQGSHGTHLINQETVYKFIAFHKHVSWITRQLHNLFKSMASETLNSHQFGESGQLIWR